MDVVRLAGGMGIQKRQHLVKVGFFAGNVVMRSHQLLLVVLDLLSQVGVRLLLLMVMVPALGARLQTQRDQQADGDGEQVQQEVAHTVDFLFRRMDLDHDAYRVSSPARAGKMQHGFRCSAADTAGPRR